MKHVNARTKARHLPVCAVEAWGFSIVVHCNGDTAEDGKKCEIEVKKPDGQG